MRKVPFLIVALAMTSGAAFSQSREARPSVREEWPVPTYVAGMDEPILQKGSAEEAIPWWVRPNPPQDPLPPEPAAPPEAIPDEARRALAAPLPEEVYFDLPGDGNLWARGVTYKARYGADGAQYIPFLGSHAPRNFPLDLRFESARVGGTLLAEGESREPSHEGTRVTYDRGGLLEVYELRPREVEQLFVVPSAGAADGDLVVRVAISSEMAFAGSTEQGLRFEAPEGLGGVLYGNAVAIDALGRRTEIPSRYEGGAIEIRLPAQSVRDAAFPVTIDPVVNTFCVDCLPEDASAPDVAYDMTNNEWCIAFRLTFSATDRDVLTRRLMDTTPAIFGAFLFLDITTADWGAPKIANNNLGNGYLIVASREADGAAPYDYDIWGRVRNAGSDTHLSPQFAIAATPGVCEWTADVGGDAYGSPPTYYLVVWEDYQSCSNLTMGDIRGRTVTHSASPLLGPVTNIAATTANEHQPAVSKSNGPPGYWGVVYTRDFTLPDRDIYFRTVSFTGVLGPGPTNLDPALANDEGADVGVIDGNRFLVVWRRQFGTDYDIMGKRVNLAVGGNTLVSPTINLSALDTPGSLSQWQTGAAVDGNGCGWAYTYSQRVGPLNTNANIFGATVYGDSALVVPFGEGHVTLGSSPSDEQSANTSSRWSSSYSSAYGGRSMTVWEDWVNTAPVQRSVRGAFHASGSFNTVPSSCGAPAPTIFAGGAPSLGGTYYVTMTPVAGGGASYMLVGLPGVLPICAGGVGSCTVRVSPILFGIAGTTFGAAVPCDATLLGATFSVQGLQLPGGPGGCAFAGLSPLLTDTVNLTIN